MIPYNYPIQSKLDHFTIQESLDMVHFYMNQSTIQEDLSFYGCWQNYQRLYTQGDIYV